MWALTGGTVWRRTPQGWVVALDPRRDPGPAAVWTWVDREWQRLPWDPNGPGSSVGLAGRGDDLWVLLGGQLHHTSDGSRWEVIPLPPTVWFSDVEVAGDALLAWGSSGLWRLTPSGWSDLAFPFGIDDVEVASDGAIRIRSTEGTVTLDGAGYRCTETGLEVPERRVGFGVEAWGTDERRVTRAYGYLWTKSGDAPAVARVARTGSAAVDGVSGFAAVTVERDDGTFLVSTFDLYVDQLLTTTEVPTTDPAPGTPLASPSLAVSGRRVWVLTDDALGRIDEGRYEPVAQGAFGWIRALAGAGPEAVWMNVGADLWAWTPDGGVRVIAVATAVNNGHRIHWQGQGLACSSSPIDRVEPRAERCLGRSFPHYPLYAVSPDTVLFLQREGRETQWYDASGTPVLRALTAGGYRNRVWLEPGLYTDSETQALVRVPLERLAEPGPWVAPPP